MSACMCTHPSEYIVCARMWVHGVSAHMCTYVHEYVYKYECVGGSYGACRCVLVHTQEPLKEAGRGRPDLIASPQKLSLPSPPKSLPNWARTAHAVGSGVRRLGFESGPASSNLAFPSLHSLVCKKGAALHFSEKWCTLPGRSRQFPSCLLCTLLIPAIWWLPGLWAFSARGLPQARFLLLLPTPVRRLPCKGLALNELSGKEMPHH